MWKAIGKESFLNSLHRTTIRSYSNDYNFWQRSIVPTMHFQPSLPKLPVPTLPNTCSRYLDAQRPLLNNETFDKTQALVNQFQSGVGEELQKLLVAWNKAHPKTSYISEPWFDMYLSDRTPLPINYNPALVFAGNQDPLIRSTNLLISSLRFAKSLRANILEPEVYHLNPAKSDNQTFRSLSSKVPSTFSWYVAYLMKAYPLDMSQFGNLFNSTRIPELKKDRIKKNESAKHVVVLRKGYFYVFDVFAENGDILPKEQILGRLKYILNDSIPENEYPIGVLTTCERDKWANLRSQLLSNGNDELLQLIDDGFLTLCLDEEEAGDDPYRLVRTFLHGDGRNRYEVCFNIFLLIS